MAGRVGLVFGILGVLSVFGAFALPWWNVTFGASAFGVTASGTANFGLFGGSSSTVSTAGSSSDTTDYSDMPNTRNVFFTTLALTGLSLLLGILFLVVGALGSSRPGMSKIGPITGFLAVVLAVLAALYVMSALPAAVNQDGGDLTPNQFTFQGFWGTQTTSVLGFSAILTWGASSGWYLMILAALLFLVGAVLTLRTSRMTAPMPPYPTTPGYYPPSQAPTEWPVQPPQQPPSPPTPP